MNEHDRASAILAIAKQYDEEFEQNALKNVRVIHNEMDNDYFEFKLD